MEQDKIYVFKFPEENDFNGFALECQMHQRTGEDWKELWFDNTIHGHMIPGDVLQVTPERFTFLSEGYNPGVWKFKLLTIGNFKREYFRLVCGGAALAAQFQTSEELYCWYREKYIRFP